MSLMRFNSSNKRALPIGLREDWVKSIPPNNQMMSRFRLALALCLALPAAAAALVWIVGRLFTDSLPQTQYIFWVPALLLLPPAALLGAGAWAVHWVRRPRRSLPSRAE